jgi:SOS-response transcriptional repressor LexA
MQPLEPGRDYYVQRKDGMATFKRLDRDGEKELVFRAINRAQFPSPLGAQRGRIARIALAVGTFISVEDDGKMR